MLIFHTESDDVCVGLELTLVSKTVLPPRAPNSTIVRSNKSLNPSLLIIITSGIKTLEALSGCGCGPLTLLPETEGRVGRVGQQ